MLLDEIRNKLLETDPVVFYGMVDRSIQETEWNYTVFERKKITINQNKTGASYYFSVHIVRENFIPEGYENSVIGKLLEIDGMRLAAEDPEFEYVPKLNTNTVVEMLTLEFVRPVKW